MRRYFLRRQPCNAAWLFVPAFCGQSGEEREAESYKQFPFAHSHEFVLWLSLLAAPKLSMSLRTFTATSSILLLSLVLSNFLPSHSVEITHSIKHHLRNGQGVQIEGSMGPFKCRTYRTLSGCMDSWHSRGRACRKWRSTLQRCVQKGRLLRSP